MTMNHRNRQSSHSKNASPQGEAKDMFEEVTAKIIQALEAGTAPWRKPWQCAGGGGFPMNAVTSRRYSGINVLVLWMYALEHGFTSNRWLTFKQAIDAGGNVCKGERSFSAVAYRPFERVKTDEGGKSLLDEQGQEVIENVYFARSVRIFNIEQCENLPDEVTLLPDAPELSDIERINRVEEFIASSGILIKHCQQSRAFYEVIKDQITLPVSGQFDSASDYYCTLLHEMVHATGHKHRLEREGIVSSKRSKELYAFEELVAEIGAAFLCAEFAIQGDLQHESYIDSWLKILREDNKAVFRAARYAREAFEYLMSPAQMQLAA